MVMLGMGEEHKGRGKGLALYAAGISGVGGVSSGGASAPCEDVRTCVPKSRCSLRKKQCGRSATRVGVFASELLRRAVRKPGAAQAWMVAAGH